ncbi:MAG TPA: T9SS type A sorting domain-containing protein [Flavobacteriaceae bacterium]|nr:T9SS type A sorting domain-containing protein [Flavobacteriaceae bacterium]
MKIILIFILLLGLNAFNINAQNNITEIEYFFDVDPGTGNAESVTVASSNSIDDSFAIPINQLSSGIHILHSRVKNDLDQWSLYARQTFYIANFSNALNNNINEAEYFFNADPGVGNGLPLTIAQNTSLDQAFSIPIDVLPTGIHILHIRVKNNFNQWGLYARQVFYKSVTLSNKEIVAAEFFIDVDPGVGNATSIALTQNESINEILNIPIPSDLGDGDHMLHIRVLDTNGTWSLYGRPEFFSTLSTDDIVLQHFKMYPNPVSDVLYFSTQNQIIEQVKLVDMNGRVILDIPKSIELLDVSNLTAGTYLAQIKTSNGNISKKIIKE